MAPHFSAMRPWVPAALVALLAASAASATPRHAISMYGEPALPPDLVSLPQADPDAPKGGSLAMGVAGSFDTLNPFITTGLPAAGITPLVVETLMGRSYDEPFTLYGLLAESVDTDESRSYVEFTLREEARFSDGNPVTPEDVLWSFETLGTAGNPRYHAAWAKVASAEQTGPRSVRFTFNTSDRELPLILGLRPVLEKAQWEGHDFEATGFEAPIGSGPYVVAGVRRGASITFRKDPDWWGRDLAFNRGQWNFDTIRYDYFASTATMFEAFKAGLIDVFREGSAARWASAYDFPRALSGEVVKSEIPHHRPSGIEGLAFNTRRALFSDWRVREALILAFDFEFINRTLTGGAEPRIESYFSNSALGMEPAAPATGAVRALLEPWKDILLPGAIEGYALPKAGTPAAWRRNLRRAAALLAEAGWQADGEGVLRDAAGAPFRFEILLTTGQDQMAALCAIYIEELKALGIEARVTLQDGALVKARTNAFDFDMTHFVRALSLSPGNEQLLYWSSGAAGVEGSRNWPGVDSPAVDALIAGMLATDAPEAFTATVQALDRVLVTGRYVIPVWYSDRSRIAHRRELHYPARLPLYGDWLGFLPDLWWYEDP